MIEINGQPLNPTLFPDGTSQVWKLPEDVLSKRWGFITWTFDHEGEIMQVAQLRDLLAHSGINASLFMPYLPYGRQDKAIKNDQSFALHSFARVLNALNFDKVSCLDPHSDAAKLLINNLRVIEPIEYIGQTINIVKPACLCFPDKGAADRYGELFPQMPSVFASKVRNQETGEITGLELHGDVKMKSVLMVDDICDGGMTFIKLAEKLKTGGAINIYLYVTHGIFSKTLAPLVAADIDRIFTHRGEAFATNWNYLPSYKLFQELL